MIYPFEAFVVVTLFLATCSSGSTTVALDEASRVPMTTSKTGQVSVSIRGFRNHKGQVLVSLFDGPKGFPSGGQAMKRIARSIDSDRVDVIFEDIPPSNYAVAVLHDEDMNFKMKTGMFGIPKEGYGVSNNVKERFGPPKYKDAVFEVKEGAGVDLTIALIYY